MATGVGRRVLGAFVAALCGGSGLDRGKAVTGGGDVVGEAEGDEENWEKTGEDAFGKDEGEVRKRVVVGVLEGGAAGGWCDEQVRRRSLRTCDSQTYAHEGMRRLLF
jgi:COP9 signalosome complex subunit 4